MSKRNHRRAQRRQRRRAEAEAFAVDARAWVGQRSADRMTYDRPVDRAARRELRYDRRRR